MIYVDIEAEKSEGRGRASANDWVDTDDVIVAIDSAMAKFHRVYDRLGHGAVVTYTITVATEASPRRTPQGNPLPVSAPASPRTERSDA